MKLQPFLKAFFNKQGVLKWIYGISPTFAEAFGIYGCAENHSVSYSIIYQTAWSVVHFVTAGGVNTAEMTGEGVYC